MEAGQVFLPRGIFSLNFSREDKLTSDRSAPRKLILDTANQIPASD